MGVMSSGSSAARRYFDHRLYGASRQSAPVAIDHNRGIVGCILCEMITEPAHRAKGNLADWAYPFLAFSRHPNRCPRRIEVTIVKPHQFTDLNPPGQSSSRAIRSREARKSNPSAKSCFSCGLESSFRACFSVRNLGRGLSGFGASGSGRDCFRKILWFGKT